MRDVGASYAGGVRQHPCSSPSGATSASTRAPTSPASPVPEGESEESWLVKEVERGLRPALPGGIPDGHREQAEYEVGVICQMGFLATSVTADLNSATPRNTASASAPAGSRRRVIAYALGITDPTRSPTACCFERFLNPSACRCPTSTWTSTNVGAAR